MRRLARDVLVMAFATGLSRILGLVRDVAVADRFGASAAYDAFLIAFFVPHFLRQLLAEGALSTALIPIYTEVNIAGGREDADRFASNLLSWLLILFPIVIALGVALAPWYVPFLASGFATEKLALTTRLTRLLFPFIATVGFAAVLMAVLNANRRFFVASIAPVWFNVGMIAGVLVIAPRFAGEPILGLVCGVLLGGLGQLVSQAVGLTSLRFRFRFFLRPLHPGIRRMARRMAPALLTLAVAQINLMVDNKLASYLGDGGISALQYAMRLFQLPLGVFAVSIATALLPRFAEAESRGDRRRFADYLMDGTLASALVILPAMTGLLLIGSDVIRLLFQHGSFDAADTLRTARALSFYVVGLLPYGLVYVYSRALYAQGRTLRPVIASCAAVAVNVAFDLLLVGPMRESGLALATALAGVLNAGTLLFFLRADFAWVGRRGRHLALIVLGTSVMAAAVWGVRRVSGDHLWWSVIAPTCVGIAVFSVYTWITGLWRLLTVPSDRAAG